MLTIFNDPFGATGKRSFELDLSETLQANIGRRLDGGEGCLLRINGELVDPLTDARLDRPPGADDEVVIVCRPGYEIAGISIWWYVAYAVVLVALIASMPNAGDISGDAVGKDSPNNKLTAQTNVARAYQAIPDVYGYRRVWPDLIQPSTVEYIDHLKYVTEWLCISRGHGTITDVQYAETPIGDISGSSYEVFEPSVVDGYPEYGQTVLNDVYEPFASDEVNGQELPYAQDGAVFGVDGSITAVFGQTQFLATFADGPAFDLVKALVPGGTCSVQFIYTDGLGDPVEFNEICTVLSYETSGGDVTFTFGSSAWPNSYSGDVGTTTINPSTVYSPIGPFTMPRDGNQIWWNTVFLRGLKASVQIKAEWWQVDLDGDEIPGTREVRTDTYGDDSYDQRFYTVKVIPAAGLGRYRIMFTRLSGVMNVNGVDVAKLEEVYSVRHYPTKVLPGVTALRVTTKATLAATGFSERKFNLRWLRHVRTLTSGVLSPSRNFARSIAHIWTIAGNDITGLDVDGFQRVNDDLGEDSPLLRFDGSLDDADMSLGERIRLVADMARCEIWRDGMTWTVTREQAREFPELQLDYRNLAAGGESSIGYAAHLPASNDGVEVEYVDEVTQSTKAYIRLDIRSGAPVEGVSQYPKKISMLGCTTQAQANNRAQLEARRLLYQRIVVNDTALSDAGQLGIGSLVRWIDPNDFGGDDGLQAGEVLAISGDLITPSEPVDWKGETSGRILFTGADGKNLGTPVVCYPAGMRIQLATVPDGLYVAGGDAQCGSRYAFAVGLTPDEVEAAGLYVTRSIKPTSERNASLALVQYDARMFEAD